VVVVLLIIVVVVAAAAVVVVVVVVVIVVFVFVVVVVVVVVVAIVVVMEVMVGRTLSKELKSKLHCPVLVILCTLITNQFSETYRLYFSPCSVKFIYSVVLESSLVLLAFMYRATSLKVL
jgi:hypothetical protein